MKKTSSILRRISFRSKQDDSFSQSNDKEDQPVEVNRDVPKEDLTLKKPDLPQNGDGEKHRRKPTKTHHITTTCSICLKDFHHPKVLPCEHVFCAKCLKPYVNPMSLLSCPSCHEEFPLREGDPNNLPDHGSVMSALRAKRATINRKPSTNNTCVTCHLTGQEHKYCLHCQKVFCTLCLVGHIGVLKTLLSGMKEHLNEAKSKILVKSDIENKFQDLKTKMDQLEVEQIQAIKKSKAAAVKELTKRHKEEESLRQGLEEEFERIIEESNEGLDCVDNEDVIKQFSEIHGQFLKSMQQLEKLSTDGLEVNEKFQLREVKKPRQKKVSLINMNGASLDIERPAEAEPEVNFSSYKRHKITDLHGSERPTCAAVSQNGLLYVCIPERKTIHVYTQEGKFQSAIEADFLFPLKIAFSPESGDIYVLDKWKHSITVLSESNLEQVCCLSKPGHALGHLQSPCGMVVESVTGNLFIADTGNDRVQVLSRTGQFVGLIGGQTQKNKNGRIVGVESELSQPEDVAISMDGKSVVVADTGNNRVRIYTISGEPLFVIGTKGHGNGQFDLPTSCAIHRNRFAVVAETGNQRVQVFDIENGAKFVYSFTAFKGIISIQENQSQNLIMADNKSNSIFMLK